MIAGDDSTSRTQLCLREAVLGCGGDVPGDLGWLLAQDERDVILEWDVNRHSDLLPLCAPLRESHAVGDLVFAGSERNTASSLQQHVPGLAYRFPVVLRNLGWATWRHSYTLHSRDVLGWRTHTFLGYLAPSRRRAPTSTAFWRLGVTGVDAIARSVLVPAGIEA